MPDATGPGLSRTARLVASDEQVSAELAEESVILSLRDGEYYGVEGVGNRVWQLLRETRTFGELVDTVVREYDVSPEQAAADLAALVTDLAGRGLVTVDGDAS